MNLPVNLLFRDNPRPKSASICGKEKSPFSADFRRMVSRKAHHGSCHLIAIRNHLNNEA